MLLAAAAAVAPAARAQVQVGKGSRLRSLVPADTLEQAANEQYADLLAAARVKGLLVPEGDPQLARLRAIARRLIAYAPQWNARAGGWRWEVNLIRSDQINAFCMPGGKIACYTGLVQRLGLTDDELAMVVGHEIAHALREHARSRVAQNQATQLGVSAISQIFGLGAVGQTLTGLGGQLLTLRFSRGDETDADIVGLELAARAGFDPHASVTLWEKMGRAGAGGGIEFLSTHPTGPDRIRRLEQNVPKVEGLYRAAHPG